MNQRDINSLIAGALARLPGEVGGGLTFLGRTPEAIVAGAGHDNQAVTSAYFPVPVNLPADIREITALIVWKAVLAQAATLTLSAKFRDATDGSGAGVADFGAAMPAAIVATGPGGGGTVSGVSILTIPLAGIRAFFELSSIADLSAANTDTVELGAVVLVGTSGKPAMGRIPELITAGAGNDNAAITSAYGAVPVGPVSVEALLVWSAALAAGETLTLAAKFRDATSSGGANAADFGTALPTAIVATGPQGGGTVNGVTRWSIPLAAARGFLALASTANLSRSGTDTVEIGAVLLFTDAIVTAESVIGPWVKLPRVPRPHAVSAFIGYVAQLGQGDTLQIAAQFLDADDATGANPAAYGATLAATTVPTGLTRSLTLAAGIAADTYKLNYGGEKTGTIRQDAVAADIQAALEALSTIGIGNVAVTGTGPFTLTFQNQLELPTTGLVTVSDIVSANNLAVTIGGGQVQGVLKYGADLSGARGALALGSLASLSNPDVDQADLVAMFVFGGYDELPAPGT